MVHSSLDGSTVLAQKTGNNTVWYYYDCNGTREALEYGGQVYYYLYNAQGDVMALYDNDLNIVAEYTYDSWGKLLSVTGSLAETVGKTNPFRYRGYYYDSETELYYLNSRYYDPETGRFINADGYVSTGQGVLGNNMFTYCGNNPVVRVDSTGNFWGTLLVIATAVVAVATVVYTLVKSSAADKKEYTSISAAAKAWAKDNKNKRKNKELGSFIYKKTNEKNNKTTYKIGRTYSGGKNNVIRGFVVGYLGRTASDFFSSNVETVAFIHSHPKEIDNRYHNDFPSEVDEWLLNLPGIDEVYVVPWEHCEGVPEIISASQQESWRHD